MALYNITGLSNTSFLIEQEEIVYAGKQGFTTVSAAIPVLCNSFISNTTSIVLSIPDLHLLLDDNSNEHILSKSEELATEGFFISAPVSQYAVSQYKEGSVGYRDSVSTASLPVRSYNIAANTITVSTISSSNPIDAYFTSLPFYVTINQPATTNNFANNVLYVKGANKRIKKNFDLTNVAAGTYTANLGLKTVSKNQVKVFVDDNRQNIFSWEYANNNTSIGVALAGPEKQITVELDYYTTPAIEANDTISFSSFSNVFTVSNVSYVTSDAFYDASLTDVQIYKVKLSEPLTSNVAGLKVINTSSDLVGKVGNLTSNSFTIDYDESYPYSYRLANNALYYVYQKNKLKTTKARLDEFGNLKSASPGYYLVGATNINRFNRTSSTAYKLLEVAPIRLGKVEYINITEQVFIDTTGGASITATIEFPPIVGADITHYDILYNIESEEETVASTPTKITVDNDETAEFITTNINNLNRGRTPGSNILVITVIPKNGTYSGFALTRTKPLIGKETPPSGLKNFNIGQQGDSLIFSWQFVLTADGYILDLDTKEVEVREYSGIINTSDANSVDATWAVSIPVERIPFPNTTFSIPVSKFGFYTYLLRVRDTSDLESESIAAATINIQRPSNIRLFKAYSEGDPSTSFVSQDGILFPNSNVYAENSFPSVSMSINDGLVLSDSTHVDNANGSSVGFSFSGGSITSQNSDRAVYTTQIRDIGVVTRGSIRISTELIIINPNTTFISQYEPIQSGITDQPNDNVTVLVDNAFFGIGHILGFSNANAAIVTYNSFHRTLTSGGSLGNVYAIRNPGQVSDDFANTNAFCLIAGVINANAIALGESYHANGTPTGSNNFGNVALSGNSYELINLSQFGDLEGSLTYLGEERSVVQNIFVRYSTDNVFYEASANGVTGLPGHGNTNPFVFEGASTNAEAGFKKYISGEVDLRYFQIQFEVLNKKPSVSSVQIDRFDYEVDIVEKNINKTVAVDQAVGVAVDYTYAKLIQSPTIVATMINSTSSYSAVVENVSNTSCNVKVFDTQSNTLVDTETVNLLIRGI